MLTKKTTDEHPLRVAILTISNSRTYSNDTNGLMIQSALAQAGHQVVDYQIVRDDKDEILSHLHDWVCSVDVIITSGGTGLAKRDVTLETIEPMFEKYLPGFRELMTAMAYRNDCGIQSVAYRSSAGLVHQCLVFCLPGFPRLIKIAMEKIILPEVFHLYEEVNK